MKEDKSFWSTLPGILTAIGGVIAAVAALLTALNASGLLHPAGIGTQQNQATTQSMPGASSPDPGGKPEQNPGNTSQQSPTTLRLSKQVFNFPGDGVKNNNQKIGPFCCTGETATITKTDGSPVGYLYFYDFQDAVNLPSGGSAAGTVRVLVCSESADQPGADQLQSALSFDAANAAVGTMRSTSIGLLKFTATLRKASLSGGTRYDMGSLSVEVDVEPIQ